MNLKKIKELKALLDAGKLSPTDFSDMKLKIINGEEINLDDYNTEKDSITLNNDYTPKTTSEPNALSKDIKAPEKSVNLKEFITEDFDKFNDKKTITMKWPNTINSCFISMWFDGKSYGSTISDWKGMEWKLNMRYIKTPDIETCVIDYNYLGGDWLFINDSEMTINLDSGENIKIIAHESNTEVGVGSRRAIQEVGYYSISKEQLKKICDSKSVEVKLAGSKGYHVINNKPNQEHASKDLLPADKFLFMCRAFYSGVYDDNSYSNHLSIIAEEAKKVKIAKEAAGGCFIATAAMGSYDHPLVLDLRDFRDNWLKNRVWGENFIKNYYNYSPRFAAYIEKKNILKLLSYLLIVKPLHILSLLINKNN